MAVALRRWFSCGNLIPFLLCAGLLSTANCASGQAIRGPYLLRVSREFTSGTACVLVNSEGGFHYETNDFNKTRVYEGKLPGAELDSVRNNLQALSHIAQSEIEEPLLHGPQDYLDIHLLQDADRKELLFRSSESQQPFAAQLKPLLHWMSDLPRLPHRELTEDAGKQNCLPRSAVALKRRDQALPAPAIKRRPIAGGRIIPATPPPASPILPLIQFELLQKNSSDVQQRCAIVANNGLYRLEFRSQRAGSKKIENRVARGQLTPNDLAELNKILGAPSLKHLRHREPPGSAPLNISGSVLDLLIQRENGVQRLSLTDATHRNAFFYGGDGDISLAKPLLNFTKETMESRAALAESARELNGCSELP